jgi:hypothetical protein
MLPVKIEGALWYEFDQNNSGGYYERGDFVADVVFVQAMNVDQAFAIMQDMIDKDDARYWCECCGERWSFYDLEGFEVPTRYGEDVSKGVDLFSKDGYILFHGLNGRTLKWSGKHSDTPTEIGRIEKGE